MAKTKKKTTPSSGKRKNSDKWFIRVRGSYLPNNLNGALTYIPYVIYLLLPLAFVLINGYDIWLSLLLVIPNWVAAVAIMNWVAANNS